MGDLIQFRPRARDAIEIKNVRLVGSAPQTKQSISGHGVTVYYEVDRDPAVFAMNDDTAPCESNPDPFAADLDYA